MTKRTKPTTASVDDVLDDAMSTLHFSLTHLHKAIADIASGKAEKTKHDDESRIAHLASKVGSIVDSARKVEAARRKRVETLTMQQVVAWLRAATPEDRAKVVREVQSMERRGTVLG